MLYTDYKSLSPIPLHRVALIRPFVEFLTDVGAPVENSLHRLRVPFATLENLNNYIPSHIYWKFLVDMSFSQGIEDLGFLVGKQFGANCADPAMTALLSRAPSLYRGLRQASELANRTVSNSRIGLINSPDNARSYFYHRPSCHRNNPAIEQIAWFGILTLCGIVRAFTGSQWQPTEIGIMAHRMPGNCICEYFADTRIKLSQPFSYITLKNELLAMPPETGDGAVGESKPGDYQETEKSFTGSLRQLLVSYAGYDKLDLKFAAELCESSTRTLQRRLRDEGTSYKNLLDQALLEAAIRKLQDPEISITEIARLLNYSDVAHFTRAFCRITGITPRVYRRQFEQSN